MSKAFAVACSAFVGLLVFGAIGIWRIKCEGFGCTGVGIAWLAWVALFVAVLVVGFVLGSLTSLGAALTRITKFALWLQVAVGAALFVLWISKTAV